MDGYSTELASKDSKSSVQFRSEELERQIRGRSHMLLSKAKKLNRNWLSHTMYDVEELEQLATKLCQSVDGRFPKKKKGE